MQDNQSCIVREPGGEVKRAYSCHDQHLGTIDEGFKLFNTIMVCIMPSCVSSADSKIIKKKECPVTFQLVDVVVGTIHPKKITKIN